MFIEKLEIAAESSGRTIVKVDPRNTSQECLCGEIVKKTLAERTHNCPKCGLVIDRDVLAAKNILRRGHRLQALINGPET
jgi:putative transposase